MYWNKLPFCVTNGVESPVAEGAGDGEGEVLDAAEPGAASRLFDEPAVAVAFGA